VCVYVDVGGGEHAVALDGHDREREEGGRAAEEVKGHPYHIAHSYQILPNII
jgi:hypothetical protein